MLIIWGNKEVQEVNIGKIRKFQWVEMIKLGSLMKCFCANKDLFRIFATAFERMVCNLMKPE